jgi:transposase
MVAESFTPGVSVSKVAQRYGVNANLLFAWRRRLGDCDAVVSPEPIKLLPVTVVAAGKPGAAAAASEPVGRMEIVLNNGERIIVGADVDASSLARLIKALLRR